MKIVLIGAGSTSFSPSVVADVARSSDLVGATLGLVDPDPGILQVVTSVAERIVEANGSTIRFEASTDRRELLPGADFVIATFAVGGARAWELDVEIPKRYGIDMPVGDTIGPGGLSRALRHVPVAVGIARDMEELCPRGRLYNYTNPLTALVRAIRRETSIDAVGLCAGPELTRKDFAKLVGVPSEQMRWHGGGFNHCFWMLDARYRGHDLYPIARALAAGDEGPREALHTACPELRDQPSPPARTPRPWEFPGGGRLEPVPGQRPFTLELLDALGWFPGPHDRHVTEFFPDFFPQGSAADHRYGLHKLPVSLIAERKKTLVAFLAEQADRANSLDPELASGQLGHSEEVVDVIAAVAHDRGKLLYGNVPNRGYVANLPPNAVVEVPLVFGGDNWRAVGAGELPQSVMPYMLRRAATTELTVEAALSGDRKVARQALLADGYVTSVPMADALLEELLKAQAQFLPQFS